MAHNMSFGHPTSLDFKGDTWKWYDIQTNNPSGPLGAHGMAEPALTNASAIHCAIFNATGKWLDWKHGAGTADKVLTALGKG
jgi:CO/xanthine dehydrogenase Mo-binding subunit